MIQCIICKCKALFVSNSFEKEDAPKYVKLNLVKGAVTNRGFDVVVYWFQQGRIRPLDS